MFADCLVSEESPDNTIGSYQKLKNDLYIRPTTKKIVYRDKH